jgi:hypothetical protein
MHLSFSDFFLQRTVPLFQFHKMRVNGHMGYLLVRFAPDFSTWEVCHAVGVESITTSCALQQIPIIIFYRTRRVNRPLERALRRRDNCLRFWYAGGKNVNLGWRELEHLRAAKVMRIQDFVLIPGPAPVIENPANAGSIDPGAAAVMTQEEERELKAQLARLRQEHRDLDAAIEALHNAPSADLLQVQRLKKRKLVLRDRIIAIEDQLTPDIIA